MSVCVFCQDLDEKVNIISIFSVHSVGSVVRDVISLALHKQWKQEGTEH